MLSHTIQGTLLKLIRSLAQIKLMCNIMLLLSGYCHWNCFSISWTLKWNTWCYSSLFFFTAREDPGPAILCWPADQWRALWQWCHSGQAGPGPWPLVQAEGGPHRQQVQTGRGPDPSAILQRCRWNGKLAPREAPDSYGWVLQRSYQYPGKLPPYILN